MEKSLHILEKRVFSIININLAEIAFITLFFAETSYYLLIMQTGIVECFHSDMSKLWMIPVGGVLGILTMFSVKERSFVVLVALFFQTLLMFFYPTFSGLTLFILGFLSGLVAPYLIYQLRTLQQVLIVLGLAYLLGTFAVTIPAEHRGLLAIVLSMVALFSSYFVTPLEEKEQKELKLSTYITIFLWLVLDATLFETLSRSSGAIWGRDAFTLTISVFHLVGLFIGYKLHQFRYNNLVILTLFALSYLAFTLNLSYFLAIVYPIVISYYNVIILKHFMRLSFEHLTLVSVSLWVSAGAGLGMALIFHHLI